MHRFQTCPLVLEAELLIKHHLPRSVEANWGWAKAKEKLPKYTLKKKKKIPHRLQFPPPASSPGWVYFLWMSNTEPWFISVHQKIHIQGSGYPQSHPSEEKPTVVPRPQHTRVRARARTLFFTILPRENLESVCWVGGWRGTVVWGTLILLGVSARGRRAPCKDALLELLLQAPRRAEGTHSPPHQLWKSLINP